MKKIYAYMVGKNRDKDGTEDVSYVEEKKSKKKRTKTAARKIKDKILKKKKKRQLRNERRIKYNMDHNIKFG